MRRTSPWSFRPGTPLSFWRTWNRRPRRTPRPERRRKSSRGTMAWIIQKLQKRHDRSQFQCGDSDLDKFIRTLVGQYAKRRLGHTYVATQPDETRVCGYYTVSAGSYALDTLPEADRKRLPRHPL